VIRVLFMLSMLSFAMAVVFVVLSIKALNFNKRRAWKLILATLLFLFAGVLFGRLMVKTIEKEFAPHPEIEQEFPVIQAVA